MDTHKEENTASETNGKPNYSNTRRKHQGNPNRPLAPKREAILDLKKYQNEKIRVQFIGGRQIVGILKGFDQLMNLVLEEVTETLRDPQDETILTDEVRPLGKIVVRGPSLLTISPFEGSGIIDNPFSHEE